MAITTAHLLLTLVVFLLYHLSKRVANMSWQRLPRWCKWTVNKVENSLGLVLFDHVYVHVDNAVTITLIQTIQRWWAVAVILNWTFPYGIIFGFRGAVHMCEYTASRPLVEPFGFCIYPSVVHETAVPWLTDVWSEQREGVEIASTLLPHIEQIFIGDLQMSVTSQSLRFRAGRLDSLLPADLEAGSLTQCLYKVANRTDLLASDWEHFGSQFGAGKEVINHELRNFLDTFLTIAFQEYHPMWDFSLIFNPLYHALGIIHRMTGGPLGPGPWLYDFEVAIEVRYRANLMDQTFQDILGSLERQKDQSRLAEECMTRTTQEMQRIEEARSYISWSKFLYSSNEAQVLTDYHHLLKDIQDGLNSTLVVQTSWETSYATVIASLQSLNLPENRRAWEGFSAFGFTPARFSNTSQNTSTDIQNLLSTTYANNNKSSAPLNKLFTCQLARLSPAELSDARSAILSQCKSGDYHRDSTGSLLPICTLYWCLVTMSEIDGAALTDRPRSWMQARQGARDKFERDDHGIKVVSEDVRRLSEQKWQFGGHR